MHLSIDEYATKFKMSKEMVLSRIRSNRLATAYVNDSLYIVDPSSTPEQTASSQIIKKPLRIQLTKKGTESAMVKLYKKENEALKNRISKLENRIDSLIDDKESMLKEERERIEKIYLTKDEQLKTMLELVSTKLQLGSESVVHEVSVPITTTAETSNENKPIELNHYLRSLNINSKMRKKIKKRFKTSYGKDIRIRQQNGLYYLDFSKYDYSDLLNE
ncbi:MAG: hypothetical protein GQ570_12610 [Helicobacteraceae bacterium]|nr:hypothetical protein [Helicobacteraceae bacterium]